MRASEWQYLCAVHDPPKSCCAIDYCCHTLDWAANTLTSSKHFPSRLTLGTTPASPQQQNQIRQLTNIFRRVYRIFAHAWFQHREIFWSVESKTGMYIFFKTVCDMYNLIPEDNYTIPPEAEGLEAAVHSLGDNEGRADGLHDDPSTDTQVEEEQQFASGKSDSQAEVVNGMGATTKRYRHAHSKSASIVPTVPEEEEEEDDDVSETSEDTSVLFDPSAQHPAFALGLPIRDISPTDDEEATPHTLGLASTDSTTAPDLGLLHDSEQDVSLADHDVDTVADDIVHDGQPNVDTAEANSA